MMESFNIDRFGKTLCWVIKVNFCNLMLWTLGFFAGVFLAEMTIFTFADSTESAQDSALSLEIPFILIGVLACISSIMSDVNKKTKRTAFLMLPASNLEKYLSLVFYVTVVWVACVVLSLIAGDMLRMAVRALCFGDEWISTIPLLLDALMPYSLKRLWMPEIVFMVLMLVFIHSLYILGGTWLRKYAFVVSSLVLIAINSILLIVFLLLMLFWAEYASIKAYIILGILIVFEIMYLFMYKNSRKNFKNMQREGNTDELIR